MTSPSRDPTLGVIVCCRDEERTVARRLANLAASEWPPAARPHRVVVVDDGSRDRTAELARAVLGRFASGSMRCEVIANRFVPGKPGAIETGAKHLRGEVDVLVLTDADVVNAPDALARLAEAFASDARLGMACGSQRFVESLREDGTTEGVAGARGGFYDRFSDLVRAVESRSGRLFSVHGQLLAWRAGLDVAPRPGFAADDLDLMIQVRGKGFFVRRIAESIFLEARPSGAVRRAQALRRARAYFQFVRELDPRRAPDPLTRWQWRLYRWGPGLFPWIALACVVAFLRTSAWLLARFAPQSPQSPGSPESPESPELQPWIPWVPLLIGLAAIACLWGLCSVIVEAQYRERRATLTDRWSTQR